MCDNECPICTTIFTAPICLTCCGNSICEDCLVSWEHPYCPLCRGGLPEREKWVPNRTLEALLKEASGNSLSTVLPSWCIQKHHTEDVSQSTSVQSADVSFFGSKVALKVINDNELSDLMSSNNIWTRLRHPNILQFHGVIESKPPVVLSEFCDAGSLRHVLKSISTSEDRETIMLNILAGIASGMEYLHSNGYVHTNLQPDNILITDLIYSSFQPNRVKLSDFKLIQHTLASKVAHPRHNVRYTAPELLSQSNTSQRICTKSSDIYSFGVVMWEMYCGGEAWGQASDSDITTRVLIGERLVVPGNIDQGIQILMKQCLQDKVRPSACELRLRLSLLLNAATNRGILDLSPLHTHLPNADTTAITTTATTGQSLHAPAFKSIQSAIEVISAASKSPLYRDIKALAQAFQCLFDLLHLETQEYFGLHDICIAVISVLKAFRQTPDVIAQLSCRILILCIDKDPQLVAPIVDMNAVVLVLGLINRPDGALIAAVAEAAIALLARLCQDNTPVKHTILSTMRMNIS